MSLAPLPTSIVSCRPPELERRAVMCLRMSLQTAVGAVLRRRRIARGLTAARLATLIESHRPLVTRVESGRHELSLGTLVRYALALDCSVSELLREAEAIVAAEQAP